MVFDRPPALTNTNTQLDKVPALAATANLQVGENHGENTDEPVGW